MTVVTSLGGEPSPTRSLPNKLGRGAGRGSGGPAQVVHDQLQVLRPLIRADESEKQDEGNQKRGNTWSQDEGVG